MREKIKIIDMFSKRGTHQKEEWIGEWELLNNITVADPMRLARGRKVLTTSPVKKIHLTTELELIVETRNTKYKLKLMEV